MNKTLLFAAAIALASCSTHPQPSATTDTTHTDTLPVSTASDTIAILSDADCQEAFFRFAKEQCGLDINLDPNKWLPQVCVCRDVEMSMTASFYTKDDTDLDAFLDDFLQQCINASVVRAVGTDPKCATVAEARERLIEKIVKNDRNPAEGYCYMGEIIYVRGNHKVIASINFGSYPNNLTTLYFKLKTE